MWLAAVTWQKVLCQHVISLCIHVLSSGYTVCTARMPGVCRGCLCCSLVQSQINVGGSVWAAQRKWGVAELERRDGKDGKGRTDTLSNGSSSWENKKHPRHTKIRGVKNMQVWREVTFPTVSNSILQTVWKHATALCKCAAIMSVFTLHDQTFFFFKLVKNAYETKPNFPCSVLG